MSRLGVLGVPAVRTLTLALLAAIGLSGCVGASLAGGPLVSAVQLLGDRTVERTVAADVTETTGVTEAVLVRMGFAIEHREHGDGVRRLRAEAEEITVHATLERVTSKLTRLGVRVEAGRLVADRDTSVQIHEQIAAALVPARAPVTDAGAAEALTTLQGEIRKLRSNIEERRVERPAPAAAPDTRAVRVEPGAIVTVPMSAALPTVGGAAPPVSVQAPVTPAMAVSPAAPADASRIPDTPDSRVAAPLRPAATLTPIQPTRGVATER
jgi:hypothetical protein